MAQSHGGQQVATQRRSVPTCRCGRRGSGQSLAVVRSARRCPLPHALAARPPARSRTRGSGGRRDRRHTRGTALRGRGSQSAAVHNPARTRTVSGFTPPGVVLRFRRDPRPSDYPCGRDRGRAGKRRMVSVSIGGSVHRRLRRRVWAVSSSSQLGPSPSAMPRTAGRCGGERQAVRWPMRGTAGRSWCRRSVGRLDGEAACALPMRVANSRRGQGRLQPSTARRESR